MATVRTGLAMNDQMTGVLKNITSSLNLTLSAMDDVHKSMGRTFDSKAINAARDAVRRTESALQDVKPPIVEADKATDGLVRKLGRMVAVLAPFLAIGKVIKGGFDRLTGIDTATAKLQALGHSGEAVETIMDNAITSVTGTAFRMESAANTAASAVAAGIKPGQQLERYLSLTADAAAIAGTNMDEMGAIFNKVTTSGMIQAQELNQLADRGIPIFQMLADEIGVTAQEVRKLASEGEVSADTFLNAVEAGFGGAAQTMGVSSFQATMDNIGAAISRIGAGFLNGTKDGAGFFNQIKPMMVNLLNSLRNLEARAAAVGDVFGKVFKFIHDNWSLIGPIIMGIVGALGSYLIVTKAITAAQWLWNAAMNANPIILIVSLVIALITWLINLWKTNDNFAAGFMRVWNNILNFFDQVPIFFTKIGFGIANAFDSAKVTTLKIMEDLINGVIDGVNWLIDVLNKIPGVSISAVEHLEYSAAEAAAAEARKQGREDIVAEMEANAAMKAAEREQKVLDMLDNRAAKRAMEESAAAAGSADFLAQGDFDGSINNIDKVGEVGKIRDSVDISSEDLKMMRELAEMNNIQNFVTLTPQLSFGDTNIRQDGRSVDEILAEFQDRLNEEMVASAQGVYNVG